MIIAIDGHSSCGKSTVAKDLAKVLSFIYVDTGAMYRAVTLYALENGIIQNGVINEELLKSELQNIHISFEYNAEQKINTTFLNGRNVEREIRSLEVSNMVSPISALAFVRRKLVELQQKMGVKSNLVMDGRDIGTVVFPNAELKIFMTCDPAIRAQRRYDEMVAKGESVSYDEILENVKKRDFIDENRDESPLRKASDALLLDNGTMSKSEQLNWILEKVSK
ncbi:MAG: (d)CMP kinase [Breznakibacter sp.]|jgi:cytidylate kinase|nr:(d)CMP kinase [Breznakibacter sp.]